MCQFLVSTRGEVLRSSGVSKAQLNESSAVESVFPLPICRWSPIILSSQEQTKVDQWFHPMQHYKTSSSSIRVLTHVSCLLIQSHIIQECVTKTTSAVFLALAPNSTFLVQGQTLEPEDQSTIPLFASLNHLMELCILDFRHLCLMSKVPRYFNNIFTIHCDIR